MTKATLVILFFMHVRWSSRLTWIVALSGFFWLLILFGVRMTDYLTPRLGAGNASLAIARRFSGASERLSLTPFNPDYGVHRSPRQPTARHAQLAESGPPFTEERNLGPI